MVAFLHSGIGERVSSALSTWGILPSAMMPPSHGTPAQIAPPTSARFPGEMLKTGHQVGHTGFVSSAQKPSAVVEWQRARATNRPNPSELPAQANQLRQLAGKAGWLIAAAIHLKTRGKSGLFLVASLIETTHDLFRCMGTSGSNALVGKPKLFWTPTTSRFGSLARQSKTNPLLSEGIQDGNGSRVDGAVFANGCCVTPQGTNHSEISMQQVSHNLGFPPQRRRPLGFRTHPIFSESIP